MKKIPSIKKSRSNILFHKKPKIKRKSQIYLSPAIDSSKMNCSIRNVKRKLSIYSSTKGKLAFSELNNINIYSCKKPIFSEMKTNLLNFSSTCKNPKTKKKNFKKIINKSFAGIKRSIKENTKPRSRFKNYMLDVSTNNKETVNLDLFLFNKKKFSFLKKKKSLDNIFKLQNKKLLIDKKPSYNKYPSIEKNRSQIKSIEKTNISSSKIQEHALKLFNSSFTPIKSITSRFKNLEMIGKGSYAKAYSCTCIIKKSEFVLKTFCINTIKSQKHLNRIMVIFNNI